MKEDFKNFNLEDRNRKKTSISRKTFDRTQFGKSRFSKNLKVMLKRKKKSSKSLI